MKIKVGSSHPKPLVLQIIIANLITMIDLRDYGHFKFLIVHKQMVSYTHNSLFPIFFFNSLSVIFSSLSSLRYLLNPLSYAYIFLVLGVLEDNRCLCCCCDNSASVPAASRSAQQRKVILNRI